MHTHHSRHTHHHSCQGCGHPISQCCCHMTCKQVDRELLVEAQTKQATPDGAASASTLQLLSQTQRVTQQVLNIMQKVDFSGMEEKDVEKASLNINTPQLDQTATLPQQFELLRKLVTASRLPIGADTAIIGGLCCVKLSLEYMPISPLVTQPSFVAVSVMDSQGTVMAWGKIFQNGDHQYKEAIITVNPGAKLMAVAVNAIGRVRWCETISC